MSIKEPDPESQNHLGWKRPLRTLGPTTAKSSPALHSADFQKLGKVSESWKTPQKADPDISHLPSGVDVQEKVEQPQANADGREVLGNISGQQFAEEAAFLYPGSLQGVTASS